MVYLLCEIPSCTFEFSSALHKVSAAGPKDDIMVEKESEWKWNLIALIFLYISSMGCLIYGIIQTLNSTLHKLIYYNIYKTKQ